jgi:hypothetical protein
MKKTTLRNATLTMEQAFNELVDPSPKKTELTEAIKFFKNACAYCGKRLTDLHWDHINPASKGGTNQIQNRVPSCKECNSQKGNGPWRDFVRQKNSAMESAINKWINKSAIQRQPNDIHIIALRGELDDHINSFKNFYKRAQKIISDQHSQ